MSNVVLIPAYRPDNKLVEFVKELKTESFDIVIVNDGSPSEYGPVFDSCREHAQVIGYEENRGKGGALKYGMAYIKDNFKEAGGFITADADGQHKTEDILRVDKELKNGKDFVLTVRKLKKDAPILSRIGNSISRVMYAIANDRFLPDNQSGLRGFDAKHIDWMICVNGTKYDYELNVLLVAEKQGIKVFRLPIEAVYFDNNAGSHFKPIADTLRIYRRYFETNAFALGASVIGIILVIISSSLWGYKMCIPTIIINWGIYAIMNFVIERYTIFRKIKYTPGVRRMVFSIFRHFIYIVGVIAVGAIRFPFGRIPFWLAYISVMIVIAVGEYFVLKISYDD